jgi:hypothetical protein
MGISIFCAGPQRDEFLPRQAPSGDVHGLAPRLRSGLHAAPRAKTAPAANVSGSSLTPRIRPEIGRSGVSDVPEVRKVMSLKYKGDFLMHGVVLQNRVFQARARCFT